jgi:hypothetical protein
MKYIIETGELRQVIESPLKIEESGTVANLLKQALEESKYSGGLGALFSVTPVPHWLEDAADNIDTFEEESTVYSQTENALRTLGMWSD